MRFTRWDQTISSKASDEIITELVQVHLSRISDEAERNRLASSLTSGNLLSLCNYVVPYGSISTYDALNIRQILAFYSKRSDLTIAGVDRSLVALQKFIEAEHLCRQTNEILEMNRRGDFSFPLGVDARIFAARRKIASILGDVPSLSELPVRFGPGATTHIPKRMASARRKLGTKLACSEELLPHLKECLAELQGWFFSGDEPEDHTCLVPVEIHTGRLDFVPKNAKTDRTVVVEPVLNTMFQCGIGDMLASRLRRSGLDIRLQEPNQEMAREGSVSGDLATLDLSSASDTIAYELIYELLPIDWAIFLSKFRTGTVSLNGVSARQQKFSSMGNGFTFPLETLVFYALALACTSEDDHSRVRVYGDDIIVPTSAYATLCELLHCLGFIPNKEKSFASGPFRESCGADYLSGINIRPVYQKTALSGFDVFRLHNFYVRNDDHEIAGILLNHIDVTIQRFGPDGYGDGHLIGVSSRRPHGRSDGYSGYTFESYTFVSRKDFSVLPGDRVYPSYCMYDPGYDCEVDPEQSRTRREARAGRISIADYARSFSPKESPTHSYSKDGFLGVSTPGTKGCKLLRIYVLG